MTQNDTIFRSFLEMQKGLAEHRLNAVFTTGLEKASRKDTIVVEHYLCHVDEEWVAAIEHCIEFIGKAIAEDRQFIRSNGEVRPIEKVKHVSRESVQHLSRHADYISKENRDRGDVVPDKLYTVERLSDYSVYENRFLYALILRIRDFVSVRREAILRSYKMYRGELTVKKKYTTGSRKFVYSLNLSDEQDDVFPNIADPECTVYIERMEQIEHSVDFFLQTPLMLEVAKADRIKSKITKTNVLRMDKNFRECVALYEYLLAYTKDGYSIEKVVTRLDPVPEAIGQELATLALLAAFLTFEHGLCIEDALKEEYEKEEIRRAERRQLELVREIEDLKRRVAETGMGMEEYMLKLEERNAALEQEKLALLDTIAKTEQRLAAANAEIERLNGVIAELNAQIEGLNAQIEGLKQNIADLHAEKARVEEQMRQAEIEHNRKIEEMRREMQAAEAAHAAALAKAIDAERETQKKIRLEYEERIRGLNAQIAEKTKEVKSAKRETASAHRATDNVAKQCDMLRARITAIRAENGLLTAEDDFTTEAGFDALEHDFEVLGKLVRDEWLGIKKMLKAEFLAKIRHTVQTKGKKSAEYLAMREDELARRARTAAPTPAEPAQEPPAEQASAEPPQEQPAAEQPTTEPPAETIPPEEQPAAEQVPAEQPAKTIPPAEPPEEQPAAEQPPAETGPTAEPAQEQPAAEQVPAEPPTETAPAQEQPAAPVKKKRTQRKKTENED